MTVKLLTSQHLEFLSLKGGCTGSSESALVKILHCWKFNVAVHITFAITEASTQGLGTHPTSQSIGCPHTKGREHSGSVVEYLTRD